MKSFFDQKLEVVQCSLEAISDDYENHMMIAYHMKLIFSAMENLEYVLAHTDGTKDSGFSEPVTLEMHQSVADLRLKILKILSSSYK